MEASTLSMKEINAFIEYLYQEGRSRETLLKYRRAAERFLQFSQEYGALDKGCVRAWRDQLVEENYCASTVNAMLAAVNGLMKFIERPDFCVKPVKCQRKMFRDKERELTRQEYIRLLQTAQKQGRKKLFLVMETICATGIRVSELQYITVQAVNVGRATVNGKGKQRVVLLPPKLCEALKRWVRQNGLKSGPVFVTAGGRPLDRSNIWRAMKRLCQDAGVAPGKVFPHNLRHLFACLFYEQEKDIAKLADVLGHSSISTTRIYIMETSRKHERIVSRLQLIIESA